MLRGVILFFMLLVYLPGIARHFLFSGYTLSDGLSQSVVTCIFQDSRGFLWVGTQNGLNCFDGYTFTVHTYRPNDSTSLSNNWIYGIAEDPGGNLWIGTKGGLNRYSPTDKRFTRLHYTTPYPAEVSGYVYDVICGRNGLIYINTPPLLTVCDPKDLTFTHRLSPLDYDGSVKDYKIPLLEAPDGRIWMGSTRGLACYSPAEGTFSLYTSRTEISLSSDNITALWQDAGGCLWVGTPGGLHRMNQDQKSFSLILQARATTLSQGNDFIRAITGDPSGALWVATEGGGLRHLIPGRDGNLDSETFNTGNSTLFHNIILSLAIDHSDNLWIGTLSGLNKTDLKKQKFTLYRKSNDPSSVDLSGNVIASLFRDEKNRLWVGTWGQGLNIFDRNTGGVDHYATHTTGKYYIPNDFVHTIFEDSAQNRWIGTRDGLLVFDREKQRFVRPEEFPRNHGLPSFRGLRIFRMMRDSRGYFWIATQDGLFRKGAGDKEPEHFTADAGTPHRIGSNLVYSVLEDSRGLIWIGTTKGVDVLDPTSGKMSHFRKSDTTAIALADDFVTCLCEDHQGDIWIGTTSYVSKYARQERTFTWYGKEQGVPGNLVYAILKDRGNSIWIATGNGLCRYDPVSATFRTYTPEEGLQSPEFNLGASFQAPDGELFFGGMNGINAFYPDSLQDNPHIPALAFTSVWKTSGGVRKTPHWKDDHTVLFNYTDYSFTVEFTALEFTNPPKNRYKYRLEGGGNVWTDLGNRHFISFSNLSPGAYVLWVTGSNNDGVWNENGIRLNLIIRPPWWRTRLALVSYFLLCAGVILLIFSSREKRHLREKSLLEAKVRERTLLVEAQKSEIILKNNELKALNTSKDKFFSIIAHDLRNPFNAIIGYSELLLMELKKTSPEELQKSLETIRDSSRQAYELLENLLLWARAQTGVLAFRPEPVHMEILINEAVTLLKPQASQKAITLHTGAVSPVQIRGDANMIRTIVRNLLTNAIKFTPSGGEIHISLHLEETECLLEVTDNGTGISRERLPHIFNIGTAHKTKGTEGEPGSGLGLILCREFVERHGGKIGVESTEGKGSHFWVRWPINEKGHEDPLAHQSS